MPLILPARTLDSSFSISNSLRFNSGDSPELTKTFGSAGGDTWSYSCWLKRGDISQQGHGLLLDPNTNAGLYFLSTGALVINDDGSTTHTSTELLRDPSAWYHILFTGNGTTNKVYVNNSQLTFSGGTPNIGNINNNISHSISKSPAGVGYMDGYLSEIHFVDGTEKAPTDFAEYNDNGVWIPKKYSGSFGTNGFKLEYKQSGTGTDSSGMGADTSGNDNHFAVTNLASTDQTTDTPTNNFATLNPTNKFVSPVVSEGNLEYDSNSSSGSSMVSTLAPSNGKWYVEVKALTSTIAIGVSEVGKESFNVKGQGASRPQIDYTYGGDVNIDGSDVDNEATFTTNDIIGILLNLDDGEVIFQKNGTSINSGTAYNLHTNTTHENTGFSVQTHTGGGNTKASFNFGNPPFAISSGNADANGYGNFEYAVPSGYYALCTKNLAEYG